MNLIFPNVFYLCRVSKQKNTDNKKLHSKLLGQKKNKKQVAKELNKQKLRELNQLANKLRKEDNSES
jgi:hypothetical protein